MYGQQSTSGNFRETEPEGKMTQMKPVKSNGDVIGFEFLCDGKKYEYSYTSGLKTR